MKVSTIQWKMARAALGWTIREVAEKARIHVNTAQRIEAGMPAQSATLNFLQRVYEDAGLEFIPAQEGVGGPGVRLKLGAELPERTGSRDESDGNGEGGAKALDAELAGYWRDRPVLWRSLSEGGRQILSSEMYGDAYLAGEVFSDA
jgi:transcriptional regulator with XRE-family HTH domain